MVAGLAALAAATSIAQSNLTKAGGGTGPAGIHPINGSAVLAPPLHAVRVGIQTPGTIPAHFEVNLGGAATYEIPIAVPPGVAGLQPKLSLVYDSGRANGLLGMGFALRGLPAIARAPRELEPDGVKGSLRYDADDRLTLDGQRLIAIGSGGYLDPNQQYRTEVETFNAISSSGTAAPGSPLYFQAKTRDGLTLRFGATNDSRIQVREMTLPMTTPPSAVRTWALSQATDRYGNMMTVEYDKDPSAPGGTGEPYGSYRPKRILYGANAVEFVYASRPDRVPSTAGGYLVLETKRLTQIKTYTDQQLVHTYDLAYAQGNPTGRSRLASVTLSAANLSYPSTVFTWQDGGPIAFGNQGNLSLVQNVQIDFASYLGSLSGPVTYWSQGANGMRCDVNGDGRDDIVIVYRKTGTNQERVRTLLSTGANFTSGSDNLLATWDNDEQEAFFLQGDVNGDGKTDLIRLRPYSGATYAFIHLGNSAGTGFDAPAPPIKVYDTPISFQSGQTYPNVGFPQFQTADVNGDGLTDLVLFVVNQNASSTTLPYGASARALLSSGTGFASYVGGSAAWSQVGPPGSAGPHFLNELLLMDVNGDGKSDIVSIAYNATTKVYSFAGSGFATDGASSVAGDANFSNSGETQFYVPGDFNGDGNMDLVHVYASNSLANTPTKAIVCLSDGKSKFYPQQGNGNPFILWPTWNAMNQIMPGDFDGDGRTDLMFVQRDATATAPAYFYRSITDASERVTFQQVSPAPLYLGAAPPIGTRFVVADFSGDGKADVLNLQGFNFPPTLSWPWGCMPNVVCTHYAPMISGPLYQTLTTNVTGQLFLATGPAPDLATKIRNGLGLEHTLTYAPLTGDVYTGASGTLGAAVYHYRPPLPVVATHRVSDGIGGERVSTLHYAGAKYHRLGRRFLGFRKVFQTDDLPASGGQQRQIDTTLEQGFPLTGRVAEVLHRLRPTPTTYVPLHLSVAAWASASTTTNGQTVFRVHPNSQEERAYALSSNGAIANDDTTTFTYDAYENPLVVTQTSQEGYTRVTTTVYNNNVPSWQLGQPMDTTVTNTGPGPAMSRRRTFTYNAQGSLIGEISEPAGTPTIRYERAYAYDAFGNLTTTREGNTQVAPLRLLESTTFDATGRFPIKTANALLQETQLSCDHRFGTVTQETDPNGIATTTVYDQLGRIASVTTPEGVTSYEYRFDDYGDPAIFPARAAYSIFTAAPNAPTVEIFRDMLDREVRTRTLAFDPARFVHRDTEYDARGRVLRRSRGYFAQSSDPVRWTSYEYDALDRAIKETRPDTTVTLRQYDLQMGNRVTTVNALNQSSSVVRDSLGRITSTKDALGRVTTRAYDALGQLITLTEPGNVVTTMAYDERGRRTAITEPNAGYWRFRYDGFGNIDLMLDAKGQSFTMEYDALNRLVKRTDPDGTIGRWTYDAGPGAIGRLVQSQGAGHFSRTLSYDALSRLVKDERVIDVNGYDNVPGNDTPVTYATHYAYKQNSRLVENVIYPVSGTSPAPAYQVGYVYNAAGFPVRVTGVTGGAGGTSNVLWEAKTRDAEGVPRQVALNNAKVRADYTYNDGVAVPNRQGTLAHLEITDLPNHQRIYSDDYSFDAIGSLVQKVTKAASAALTANETYTYDGLNRIEHVSSQQGANTATLHYAYDVRGNLSAKSDVGAFSYGPAATRPHAVASIAASNGTVDTFTYDANGNLETGSGRTTLYTSFNRPERISIPAQFASQVLRYDPDRRVLIEDNTGGGHATTRLVAGNDYEVIVDGTNPVTENHYVQVGGWLVAVYRRTAHVPDQTLFPHPDRLGTVQVVTDAANTVVERLSYDASGRRRSYTLAATPPGFAPAATRRGFTGQAHAEHVGLIATMARTYEPSLGSFTTVDPLRLVMPERASAYAYARQNPLRFTDPTGLQSHEERPPGKGVWLSEVEVVEESRATRLERQRQEREEFRRMMLPNLSLFPTPKAEREQTPADRHAGAMGALWQLLHPNVTLPEPRPIPTIQAERPLWGYAKAQHDLQQRAANGDEVAQYQLYVQANPWWVVLLAPNNPDAKPIHGNGPYSTFYMLDLVRQRELVPDAREIVCPYGYTIEWMPLEL